MIRRPAVVVHGIEDVRMAISAGLPLTLLSAPGAAMHAGCGWWRALSDEARRMGGELIDADVLDCADATGRAFAALRIGQRALVLDASAPAHAALAGAAAALGVMLLLQRPPALDLGLPGSARGLAAWLGGAGWAETRAIADARSAG